MPRQGLNHNGLNPFTPKNQRHQHRRTHRRSENCCIRRRCIRCVQKSVDTARNRWHNRTEAITLDPFDDICATLYNISTNNLCLDENSPPPEANIENSFIIAHDLNDSHQDNAMVPYQNNIVHANVCLANSHVDIQKRAFLGALIDTGAQNSVIGNRQSESYLHHFGKVPLYRTNTAKYRFGTALHRANRSIRIEIITPGTTIAEYIHIVGFDVPLLLGLDLMKKYKLQPNTVSNILECKSEGWVMPLVLY